MPILDTADLQIALQTRNFPTIVMWNRLEGRPRTQNFDRALRAEVRDALWMLTRQWQFGEFLGDDAGSPLGAQVQIATSQLYRYSANGATEPYDDNTALEAKVERLPIAMLRGQSKIMLDLRAQVGRQWNKLLRAAGLSAYETAYRGRYSFSLPTQDRSSRAAEVYAHAESWQQLAALAGRATDGGELYLYLKADAAHRASDGISLSDPAHKATLDKLGQRLVAWFDGLYLQPANEGGWDPAQLEYQFSCATPTGAVDKTLTADRYAGGHLDWHAFDFTQAVNTAATAERTKFQGNFTRSFLPAQLAFDGMPNTRWWKFEDNKVGFGAITPATTDIGKLLMVEFALIYANDWFLVPFQLPAGSLALIRAMTVSNSFGERFWIDPSGSGAEAAWQQWRMYTLSTRGAVQADTTTFLAPAVPKIQDGDPLDEVYLIRDEMANMVWGVETVAPLINGGSRPGGELARETAGYHRRLIGDAPPPANYAAPIYYRAMTSAPENWIPMVPVHVQGSNREIELQRGGMLRLLEGDTEPPVKIEPATLILRRGLDTTPKAPLFVHEEEAPRAGTRVVRAFQRTRWRNGRTLVWLGMSKTTGRGEGASRLAFDQIAISGRAPDRA